MSDTEMCNNNDDSAHSAGKRRHSTGTSATTRHTPQLDATTEPAKTVRPDGCLHRHLGRKDWCAQPMSGVVHHETRVCNPCDTYSQHLVQHLWLGDQSLQDTMDARNARIVAASGLCKKLQTTKSELNRILRDCNELTNDNGRLRADIEDLRDENDRLRIAVDNLKDDKDDMQHVNDKLRDDKDDMQHVNNKLRDDLPTQPPPEPAHPVAKLPLAARIGCTLLTPGADGHTRYTFLPKRVLSSDQARFNMLVSLPPPLGLMPELPFSPAAMKVKHFVNRATLTPADRRTQVHEYALARWAELRAPTVVLQPDMATMAQDPSPSKKKRGADKDAGRPLACNTPVKCRQWLVTHPDPKHLRQHTRGVGTSNGFPMRNVSGYVAVIRLAPPRGKARSVYMLRAVELFRILQAYCEALEASGDMVAGTRHNTLMAVNFNPSLAEVASHFALNGLTLAEADNYWAWGQEFISTFISDVDLSEWHPARLAYNKMVVAQHLPPTLKGFPKDHPYSSSAPTTRSRTRTSFHLVLYPLTN
ncbi:hypothetical protein FA95DRAFT_1613409 [Auriscalpium vulgare]|uniref:Uncharacterized protein n=1 Tax=Auriscalpium vulgare TaxID=40419 RepID=A0ACB8R345_9AGAM|nr:hypothetical protein FA95DRAFT_1613409 [Auriscalpium vulgare]